MAEPEHFLQPELDISEAKFVKAFTAAGMVVGAALGVGGVYELATGGSFLVGFGALIGCAGTEAGSISTYFAARDRGNAASEQLRATEQEQ